MALKCEKVSDGLYRLDCLGYVCPHPQIYTKKVLEKISDGDVLEVIFDNPSSSESIIAMCNAPGTEIIESTQSGGEYLIKIKKG